MASSKLGRTIRHIHERALNSWACSFKLACAARSTQWVTSLATCARTKAAAIELATLKARKQAWSAAIGAGSEPNSTGPTRLAYRWVRGLTGWTKCSVGPAALNDEVIEQQTTQFEDVPNAHQHQSHCHRPIMPLAEQAEVNKAANDWGNTWGEHKEYRAAPSLVSTGTVDRLPPLSPDNLAAAGRSFPRCTALGSDNILPAVYATLPRIAL